METEKNKEFASLIGRRLRDAYGTKAPDVLPEAIALRLELLRKAEARSRMGAASTGADGTVAQRRSPIDNEEPGPGHWLFD